MDLEQTLEAFFSDHAPLAGGDTVLIAFSGGCDSTALLAAMCDFARARRVRVAAAHVDHQLDPESHVRAQTADRAASQFGVRLIVRSQDVAAQKRTSESLEMAARRIRYRELENLADSLGARYLVTAHHRDDQAETVLLRIAAGHGLSALGGVPARRGAIVRPLLARRRAELLDYVGRRKLSWIEDPTNRDVEIPRNRVRHLLLPALEVRDPDVSIQLARLAEIAARANARLAHELALRLAPCRHGATVTVARAALEVLPGALLPYAIVHLLRTCGSRRRPSRQALGHVEALLAARGPIGVDLGGRWRIEDTRAGNLQIRQTADPTPHFAYNLGVPGEVHLGELSSSLRLQPGSEEPWMFRGDRLRTGLSVAFSPGETLTVRNRRPGDRIQPLGSASQQKLKDLLIDHGIPKHERNRLPLLCRRGRILWVPGVTIDHEARVRTGSTIWLAEIIPDE